MLKKAALVFGAVLLLVGVLGFVPAFTPNGNLLGLFAVNGIHNWVHILTGIVGLAAGMGSVQSAKMYFQVFGVVYALVAVLGLFMGDGLLLGLVEINMSDNLLHIVIAAVALYLGFGTRADKVEAPAPTPTM